MGHEVGFTPLNLQTWNRGQVFYYFSKMAPTGYSLTVDVDITNMLAVLKAKEIKFFPAYLWLVTKVANQQPEFKIAEKDGQLGYYDTLTPLYASFHEDDKTFSLMWTEYTDNFMEFYRAYLDNQRKHGARHGILAQEGQVPPENAYTVSCVPWIAFKHFSVLSYENKPYYFPSIEAGKFCEQAGKTVLPLSITCHHATTDGYHVSQFIETFQLNANRFDEFIAL